MSIGQLKVEAFNECGRRVSKCKEKVVKKLITPHYTTYNAKTQLPEAERYRFGSHFFVNLNRFIAEKLTVKPFKK